MGKSLPVTRRKMSSSRGFFSRTSFRRGFQWRGKSTASKRMVWGASSLEALNGVYGIRLLLQREPQGLEVVAEHVGVFL